MPLLTIRTTVESLDELNRRYLSNLTVTHYNKGWFTVEGRTKKVHGINKLLQLDTELGTTQHDNADFSPRHNDQQRESVRLPDDSDLDNELQRQDRTVEGVGSQASVESSGTGQASDGTETSTVEYYRQRTSELNQQLRDNHQQLVDGLGDLRDSFESMWGGLENLFTGLSEASSSEWLVEPGVSENDLSGRGEQLEPETVEALTTEVVESDDDDEGIEVEDEYDPELDFDLSDEGFDEYEEFLAIMNE